MVAKEISYNYASNEFGSVIIGVLFLKGVDPQPTYVRSTAYTNRRRRHFVY